MYAILDGRIGRHAHILKVQPNSLIPQRPWIVAQFQIAAGRVHIPIRQPLLHVVVGFGDPHTDCLGIGRLVLPFGLGSIRQKGKKNRQYADKHSHRQDQPQPTGAGNLRRNFACHIRHCGKSGPLECGSSSSPVREALLQERISAVTPTEAMKQLLKAVIEKSGLGKIVIKGDLLKEFSKLFNGSSSRFD